VGRRERLNEHPLFWIFKVEFVVSGADGDKGDSGLMEPGDPPMPIFSFDAGCSALSLRG
jgi:hypothetical protein